LEEVITGFSERKRLAPQVFANEPLLTKEALKEFKRYLGHEIQRAAEYHDVPPEELCDRTGRTLHNWVKP